MTAPGIMWRKVPRDIKRRIDLCLDTALEKSMGPVTLFFRADDAGIPGKRFQRLVTLFAKHRMPLNLAVVPAWLTGPRWRAISGSGIKAGGLLCWHMHGWRHINHESKGKKQEFGPSRSGEEVHRDLQKGKTRLIRIMGNEFCPVFTPPWNRCGVETLHLLPQAGFKAVSRSRGSRPPAGRELLEITVNVDLHTLKERTPALAWRRLFSDLSHAVSGGWCGIMIHHRIMEDAAFDFLDALLMALSKRDKVSPVNFRDLI